MRTMVAFPPARMRRGGIALAVGLACLVAGLTGQPGGAAAQSQSPTALGQPVEIRGIQLRKEGTQLNVHFLLSEPTPHQISANLTRRVLVVKFKNAVAAFPNEQRDFAFNDPFVVGVSFERVREKETWAKIKLRSPHLVFQSITGLPTNQVAVGFTPAPFGSGIALTGIRLAEHKGGSRLVLDLTGLPRMEVQRDGRLYIIRLTQVVPRLITPAQAQDRRLSVTGVTQDGPDTLVRIRVTGRNLQASPTSLPSPPRLVFDFMPGAAPPGPVAGRPGAPAIAGPRQPATRDTPLTILFNRLKRPLVETAYRLAEQEFQAGGYRRANQLFLRVFDTIPRHEVGLRASFRAAESQYRQNVAENATNYHAVIINLQAAIRAAEVHPSLKKSVLIPQSLFLIARAYQRMSFHFESNIHFQLLQNDYPANAPYTQDSYFYQGLNFLALNQSGQSIASFLSFLDSTGDPELEGPARYHLGDAYFGNKKFIKAKEQFDQARKLDEKFPETRPLLLFHMGETYYENANFQVARIVYRVLLERFPEKSYAKLVGLRLGDFLREEGKENEAIAIYRQVIRNAPLEVRLRGKLRIANLLATRPEGKELDEALKFFDQVIAEGGSTLALQEALLRKGLALTLHGRHQSAIDTFEKLARDHPKGPYTRDNLVKSNIEENLKAQISVQYSTGKFWEAAKLYNRYKDQYFQGFRFPHTVFLVGRSYHRLGLYDEAIGLYDEVLRGGKAGPLESLLEIQKAQSMLDKDDLGSAETQLIRFIQSRRKDVHRADAQMMLGKVYFTGRRYEEALRSYRLIDQDFKSGPNPALSEVIAEMNYELGRINKELGRTKEALDRFHGALSTFHHPIQGPNVPEFIIQSHFLAADMLFDLTQYSQAIQAYRRAIQLYPDHGRASWAQYQIGLTYRRTGEERKALEEFNLLLEKAKTKPGELWEPLARENRRDLANKLGYQDYLKQ